MVQSIPNTKVTFNSQYDMDCSELITNPAIPPGEFWFWNSNFRIIIKLILQKNESTIKAIDIRIKEFPRDYLRMRCPR